MSNESKETIADIVREMRTLGRLDEKSTDKIPRSLQALGLRTYADRIEAAAKREREAGAETAQICGEIGEMIGREAACKESVTNCNQLGNAAAMREALDMLLGLFDSGLVEYSDSCDTSDTAQIQYVIDKAEAALSAPPRNCDRFATAKEAGEAFISETCENPCGYCTVSDECHNPLVHECGIDWLFAEVKGEMK